MNASPSHPAEAEVSRSRRWNPFAQGSDAWQSRDDEDDGMDLLELWRSVSKRKWSILGLVMAVGLLATALVLSMTPIYKSTVVVMFEAGKSQVVSIEDVYAGASGNREFMATQVEIIRSREVALKTVQALRLWEHPAYDPRNPQLGPVDSVKATVRQWLGMDRHVEAAEWTPERLAEAVVGTFQDAVTVDLQRNSMIARVSVESPDAALAARAANALAKVFIENDLNARYEMTRQATNWLQERVVDLREKVAQSERALQAYRERTGIISAQGAALSGSSNQLDALTARLIEARLRRAEAETAYNQVKNAPKDADLSEIPTVLRSPGIPEAKRNLQEAERKFGEVSQRYGPEHPRHVAAKADLEASLTSFRNQQDIAIAGIKRSYEAAAALEREMDRALAQARSSVQNLNRS